ncbi:MAG: hypothetical protein HDT41_00480 [Lachnospiraceae bacterium]|nr:hypothetical protein [Lachnospiraceae bacterium]
MIKWKRVAVKTVRSDVPTIYDYVSKERELKIFHNKFGSKKDRWILEDSKGHEIQRFKTLKAAKAYVETNVSLLPSMGEKL